ncbi:unnamed protein product [Allacma fusca]|uniref:Uncharacterized protein n=1 Tax=Allacma fusca TaxID=39272 RepID=A0A8J2PCH0_9HEXA|nr:unnamed protein product [Allacma fusca]
MGIQVHYCQAGKRETEEKEHPRRADHADDHIELLSDERERVIAYQRRGSRISKNFIKFLDYSPHDWSMLICSGTPVRTRRDLHHIDDTKRTRYTPASSKLRTRLDFDFAKKMRKKEKKAPSGGLRVTNLSHSGYIDTYRYIPLYVILSDAGFTYGDHNLIIVS